MPETYKGLRVPLYVDVADGPLAFRSLVDSGPIPRFATTATRNAAIPTPVRGQVVWRNDLTGFANTGGGLEVYSGSAWRSLIPATPPTHTHPGSAITGETMSGDRLIDHSIEVAGANDKLTGVIASGHLPAATASVAGIIQTDHAHGYLPLAGGTMTGVLKILPGTLAAPGLQLGNSGDGIFSDTPNALEFKSGSSAFRFSGNGLALLPGNDNVLSLGGADYRWKAIWAVDGSINTSDPSKKHIRGRLTGALSLLRKIDPIQFRWRETDDGIHYGFNAAEVKTVIPQVVKGEPGSLGIRERDLLAVLWAAVRELDARTA